MTVTASEIPGNTLFLPPEKPAKKCASIKPSAIKREASAATLSIMQSGPEGSTPTFTLEAGLWASWTTILSLNSSYNSAPNLYFNSSVFVGRWKPVATSKVIFISGLPLRRALLSLARIMPIDSVTPIKIAMPPTLGTGLVWSEIIMVQSGFPCASTSRVGLSIGFAIASATISLPFFVLFSWSTLEVSTGVSAGTSRERVPCPYRNSTFFTSLIYNPYFL